MNNLNLHNAEGKPTTTTHDNRNLFEADDTQAHTVLTTNKATVNHSSQLISFKDNRKESELINIAIKDFTYLTRAETCT